MRARALSSGDCAAKLRLRFRGPMVALDRNAARNLLFANNSPRPAARIAIVDVKYPSNFRNPRDVSGITLRFNDTVHMDDSDPSSILFAIAHRKRVLKFVESLSDCTTLVVNCYGGASRSRAIVAALRRLRGDDDLAEWVYGEPNEHVYRVMLGHRS